MTNNVVLGWKEGVSRERVVYQRKDVAEMVVKWSYKES